MSTPKIVVVVPSIRPECHAQFVKAWTPLFEKHKVTLVTVWDGDRPRIEFGGYGETTKVGWHADELWSPSSSVPVSRSWDRIHDLFCRHTDAVRNLGFVAAAQLNPDYVLTLDDDCYPISGSWSGTKNGTKFDGPNLGAFDPIQAHLDALNRRVPLSWMNTAHDTDLYLRGVPYGVRNEAPVMLSHGVWVGTPDFDGETQLKLEGHGSAGMTDGVPHSLPYYVGPIPRGVLFPLCGMNVMVKRDALPYLYYAPMGVDSGVPDLHRFADIYMGCFLKVQFDHLWWGIVTGYSTVHHTRASDAKKNFEAEKLGRQWMEWLWKDCEDIYDTYFEELRPDLPDEYLGYLASYKDKRTRYQALITSILEKNHVSHD